MIPLAHDFRGEAVLVFGGGRVGARKARHFASEADVLVVSPEFADAAFGDADLVRAAPGPNGVSEWVERVEPVLVVAATDSADVNDAAEEAAREHGSLVNRADESGGRRAGSVTVPATVEDDPVTVAVSTGGSSPALAKHLRERVADEIAGAGGMADLSGAVREELKAAGVPPDDRRRAVRRLVRAPSVWKALRTRGANPRQQAEVVLADELGEQYSP
ncbi:bifunctional precorrin-2 dehydrogenase/sirohydrochlorin ferrochelatase [Salarchaeum sp. JOR-1]|uniref:precorrin-2 dehydrogenase/sirohydrochlorin ferrochelatase family protein n=1 Tax=Salarchaeum sp. JOR-1 TaxID=2599399 RepID=UPI0011983E8C|nr:bifunctional precorrin-2 dehydrogenase/sirohydrochlorin ferrochelatase [Salarchaeum sp. JOR-1]QDX40650.1 bifunctional precorrin-2 dehydrogenase/sirohydrochlorin ferrochelatase [Salarchaeum sp. JOR-1]